jgi:hypothetical protein
MNATNASVGDHAIKLLEQLQGLRTNEVTCPVLGCQKLGFANYPKAGIRAANCFRVPFFGRPGRKASIGHGKTQ